MAISNFQPKVWSAELLSVLAKSLVYGGPQCVNRNYEGDISEYGDTVHIVSIADPTITPYAKNTDMSAPQALTDADRTLLIDQMDSFNFQIDDIDARQARSGGALMSEAAQRAAFGLGDVADQFLVKRMLGGDGTTVINSLGVVDASTTATNVYDQLIVPAGVKLNQNNVPQAGRFLVLDPASYGKLLLDARFIKVNEAGLSDGLRNGVVGRAGGFEILMSNNAFQANRTVTATGGTTGTTGITAAAGSFNQGDIGLSIAGTGVGASSKISAVSADGGTLTVTVNNSGTVSGTLTLSGGGQVAIAGSSIATAYAEQINKVEAYRPEKRFADALKGLHLYGAKVVRPTALVAASVKVA